MSNKRLARPALTLVNSANVARLADAHDEITPNEFVREAEPAVAETNTAFRRQPRQSRGQRRIDLLLDAAAAVIAEQGIGAATAEAIAIKARTAKGSLYQFFPNRDAVLAALALRYADELRHVHERVFPSDASGLSLNRIIDHIVKPMAAFHDSNPAFSRVFAMSDGPDGSRTAPGRIRSQLYGSVVERLDLLFASRNPRLGARERRRVALVTTAIGQAILARRDAAVPAEKKPLLDDLKRVLLAYLSPILEVDSTVRNSRGVRGGATTGGASKRTR